MRAGQPALPLHQGGSTKKSRGCRTCTSIERLMDEIVNNIEGYTHDMAHNRTEAFDIPKDDLALHVNEKDAVDREIIKRRLERKDPDTPDIWLKILYNQNLDSTIQEQIKENDGELAVAIRVYNKLGKIQKRARAEALVYSD